jgi:CHASE2 domain-containing sensor protein
MGNVKPGLPAVGLAAGVGAVVTVLTTLRRRAARVRDEHAQIRPEARRRRIDVVAIDEAAGDPERKGRE